MVEQSFDIHEVICRQGDETSDLMFVKEGKLLVCTVQGTQVKAIGKIGEGEFVGELSFFDGTHRASHIVAIEKSKILIIPKEKIFNHLPLWLVETGKNLTKKIRLLDEIIQNKNLRLSSSPDQKPLSIDEQRILLAAINKKS